MCRLHYTQAVPRGGLWFLGLSHPQCVCVCMCMCTCVCKHLCDCVMSELYLIQSTLEMGWLLGEHQLLKSSGKGQP